MNDNSKSKSQLIEELKYLRRRVYELENIVDASDLILQNDTSAILRIDLDGGIRFVNSFAQQLFGFDQNELIGRNIIGTLKQDDERTRTEIEALAGNLTEQPDEHIVVEDQNLMADGTSIWISWTYRALMNKDGEVNEILCIGTDITRRKFIENELARIAKTDLITGFSTRLDFTEKFELEKYRAARSGLPFSLILCGIDGFGDLASNILEDAENEVIKNVAESMKRALRRTDVVGRWSEGLLVIMLPETGVNGAKVVAGKIQSMVAESVYSDGDTGHVITMSYVVTGINNTPSLGTVMEVLEGHLESIQIVGSNTIEEVAVDSF